jgi:non-specific serine/threonine protein kinase
MDTRRYGGFEIYRRGVEYYHAGRVKIEVADDLEAHCRVRGTRYYTVHLWVEQEDLGASCSCPYAASGWFCKHMVAASLTVRDHLRRFGSTSWRTMLENTLQEGDKVGREKKPTPYWFFLSLQVADQGWKLLPYRLWIERFPKGIFPSQADSIAEMLPELINYNQWLLEYIKPLRVDVDPKGSTNTGPEAIAFGKFLLSQERQQTIYYTQFYRYEYPLGEYLTLLPQVEVPLFLGNENNPVHNKLRVLPDPGEFVMRISQGQEGITLTMDLIVGEQTIHLPGKRTYVLTETSPNWLMIDDLVLRVESPFSTSRLTSWLRSPELTVPSHNETEFLTRYFPRIADQFPITGENIEWLDVDLPPVKRLYLSDESGELLIALRFGYGEAEVDYHPASPAVSIRRLGEGWTLERIHRKLEQEKAAYEGVPSAFHGLKRSSAEHPPNIFQLRARVDPIDFLIRHVPRLTAAGFEIYGEEKLQTARVNRKQPSLSLNVSSGIDWFDVQTVVMFGDVEATLKEIRAALRRRTRYVKLADGTIGEIPEDWIRRYKHLFGFGEHIDGGFRLSNQHISLIDSLLNEVDQHQTDEEFRRRRKKLLEFEAIKDVPLPVGFQGELRPYQKAGYDWLHFLHEYHFGGCLADDMGLGKTVETLVFLLSLKESGHTRLPSLLVLPRSLLVNWQRETARFTPTLKTHFHFGKERGENSDNFDGCDLVLTTYGTMLRDVNKLRAYKFHYVVLDESQAIKNPLAKTSKAARLLTSDHRLVLTGTPVENSTFELWSQFAFLNPGLLGNLEFFKSEFGKAIEQKQDEAAAELLRRLVYPFILRRTKEQVAPELPPRTERVVYTDMEPAQANFYSKTRDYYRAMLMGLIDEKGMENARMKVLEGLLRLRQISNHPRLVNAGFRGESAKFELLLETLQTLQAEGHKALVFSQFVQMLKLVRSELDALKIPYVYLDGHTRKRQERVDTFQNSPDIPFFLISLKAGGVGLNLTAADYVIHIDPWWNPAVEIQATDRTHRIGQDKPVFIYKLITRDTVEEKILLLQEKKKALVDQLIATESSFFKALTKEDVEGLFS